MARNSGIRDVPDPRRQVDHVIWLVYNTADVQAGPSDDGAQKAVHILQRQDIGVAIGLDHGDGALGVEIDDEDVIAVDDADQTLLAGFEPEAGLVVPLEPRVETGSVKHEVGRADDLHSPRICARGRLSGAVSEGGIIG